MIDKQRQIDRASVLIKELAESNFYGQLEVRFEHGNIVHLRKVENLKIDHLSDNPVGEAGLTKTSP